MKPIIILPPKAMSDEDIKMLRDNELCVVVAKDPTEVKFVDPIPAASQRTKMEDAAIRLSRKVLTGTTNYNQIDQYRPTFAQLYVELLVSGTPLDPRGTEEERLLQIQRSAKEEEARRIGREEAKAESAAKKSKLLPQPISK